MDPISPGQNSEPIYHASRNCLALFDEYISDTVLSEESLALVGELRGQFKTWAAYIGAFAVPRASLDARLDSHDDIKNMVLDLLTMLERNLKWAKENQLEKGEKEDKEELEASLGTSAVKSTIERLFILAVAIRRSARQTHDVRQKTYSGGNGDSSCLLLLKARYPNARKSLLDQLAQSVHARGVYLQYLQSHNRKLAHQREPSNKAREDPLEEKTRQLGDDLIPAKLVVRNSETELETTPSMLSPTTVIRQHMRSVKPSRSLISTGSTVKDMEGDELPYPPMPKRDSRTGRVTCTICSEPMEISALTEEKWKPHVDGDLHPYVCISEQCKEPPKFFKRKQDWVEHMQTRHTMKWVQRIHTETWRCDIEHSESKYFDQKDHFASHLKDDHNKQFTSSQIQGRARRSKKTATREPFVCPLCDCVPDDIEPIIHEKPYSKLTRHIRHHLKYISFLSLSYLGVDFGDGESIAGSSSDGNEKRVSRTSRSLNNLRDVSLSDIPETEVLDNHSCRVHDQVFFDDPPLDDGHLDWNFMPLATLETNWDMLRKGLGRSQSPWAKFGGPVYFGTEEHFDPSRECLRSLAFPEMGSRSNNIDAAATGTCEWLLRHEKFTSWAACGRGLLWIKGKPGSGKSTLLRYVLDHVMEIPKGALILSFFFHGRGSELQRTPLGLFRSLLHQLLRQVPEALTDLVATFQQRCETIGKPGEKWQWHPRELHRFFELSLLKVLKTRLVWLLVDALDECGEENAVNLAEECKSLLQRLPPSGLKQFHICFTCRHYPILDQACQFEICLEDENRQDISTYVRAQLSVSRELTTSTIPDLITKHAQGVFIWAHLVVDQILDLDNGGAGLKKIEDEISSIPPDLDDLYHGLIRKEIKRFRKKIRESLVQSALGDKKFLPRGEVSKLVTEKAVRKLMPQASSSLVEFVCGRAQKAFLTVLWHNTNLHAIMESFQSSGLTDKHLPIGDPEAKNGPCRMHDGGTCRHAKALDVFHDWDDHEFSDFYKDQWTFCSPIFGKGGFRQELHANYILPFTWVSDDQKDGHFSSVFEATLHADHYQDDTKTTVKSGQGNHVALKKLKRLRLEPGYSVEKAWESEAAALHQISTLRHKHLVSRKGAFKHGTECFIMYEWADGGTLRDVWETEGAKSTDLDANRVMGVLEQLVGLSGALSRLHNTSNNTKTAQIMSNSGRGAKSGGAVPRSRTLLSPRGDDRSSNTANSLQVPKVRFQGDTSDEEYYTSDNPDEPSEEHWRHGDLKPDNILQFKDSTSTWPGTLKIAGLGCSAKQPPALFWGEVHPRILKSEVPEQYNAPEVITNQTLRLPRSRRYDIWSMGCIILEFVIWLLYGHRGLDNFYQEGAHLNKLRETLYFTVDSNDATARVSNIVKRWMDYMLQTDPECSSASPSAIKDLIELVRDRLLVVALPKEGMSDKAKSECRAGADELEDSLGRIQKKAMDDEHRGGTYLFTRASRAHVQIPDLRRERSVSFLSTNSSGQVKQPRPVNLEVRR